MLPDSENIPVPIRSFKHLYRALAHTKTFLLKTERLLISTGSLGSQEFLFAYFSLRFFFCLFVFKYATKPFFPPVSRTNKGTITWWLSIYVLSECNVSRVSWKLIKGKKPGGLAVLGTGVWLSRTGVWPFGKAASASGRTPGWEEAGTQCPVRDSCLRFRTGGSQEGCGTLPGRLSPGFYNLTILILLGVWTSPLKRS